MKLEKMNKKQLQDLVATKQHTLRSIEIANQNWRNAMFNRDVKTGKIDLLEFNEKWDEAQKPYQRIVKELEKEIFEIHQKIQKM